MTQIQTITTLHDLFDANIGKFVFAEVALNNHLSSWTTRATSIQLKATLTMYQEYVKKHIRKLESLIRTEEITSLKIGNHIMEAFVQDTQENLTACADPEVRDASLLASIQSINHFKISAYGTATAFANALELFDAAKVLHEAEFNEKQIDEHLNYLAEHEINIRANAPFLLG
jgi:ferritin-like metal-binding protein YciE